eukprot:6476451-Amphidinium_carterae.1
MRYATKPEIAKAHTERKCTRATCLIRCIWCSIKCIWHDFRVAVMTARSDVTEINKYQTLETRSTNLIKTMGTPFWRALHKHFSPTLKASDTVGVPVQRPEENQPR